MGRGYWDGLRRKRGTEEKRKEKAGWGGGTFSGAEDVRVGEIQAREQRRLGW